MRLPQASFVAQEPKMQPQTATTSRSGWLRAPNVTEWIVIAAIIVALGWLLFTQGKWAASGTLRVPVRVVVFDATTHQTLRGASVRVVRLRKPAGEVVTASRPLLSADAFAETTDPLPTDKDGAAMFHVEMGTGASHKNPQGIVHTDFYWVMVRADGYGTALVPIRHEPTQRKWLSEQAFLPVYAGLSQSDQVQP
jgi:hypothetical protein